MLHFRFIPLLLILHSVCAFADVKLRLTLPADCNEAMQLQVSGKKPSLATELKAAILPPESELRLRNELLKGLKAAEEATAQTPRPQPQLAPASPSLTLKELNQWRYLQSMIARVNQIPDGVILWIPAGQPPQVLTPSQFVELADDVKLRIDWNRLFEVSLEKAIAERESLRATERKMARLLNGQEIEVTSLEESLQMRVIVARWYQRISERIDAQNFRSGPSEGLLLQVLRGLEQLNRELQEAGGSFTRFYLNAAILPQPPVRRVPIKRYGTEDRQSGAPWVRGNDPYRFSASDGRFGPRE